MELSAVNQRAVLSAEIVAAVSLARGAVVVWNDGTWWLLPFGVAVWFAVGALMTVRAIWAGR